MEKELLFITVIGEDQKGIVAKISGLMFDNCINIEDIDMGVKEGYFVMTMFVDIKESKKPLADISDELKKLGKDIGLNIQIQHENLFKMMHRV
ncbi:ACT domain-containing protein [Candidatus Woesearchaeota archaeon]|nr:ACT domain-containing protein [Candidatus Woesearchaeota archaeon]